MAIELGESLAQHGFRVIVLCSTHGGNTAPLRTAAARINRLLEDVVARAPEGDVGPEPGAHSGEWLTSVLLTLRPDLVEIEKASSDLQAALDRQARTEAAATSNASSPASSTPFKPPPPRQLHSRSGDLSATHL